MIEIQPGDAVSLRFDGRVGLAVKCDRDNTSPFVARGASDIEWEAAPSRDQTQDI